MENSNLNFSEFKKVSFGEWVKEATDQLKGDLPQERLGWSTENDLQLQGYYDSSDQSRVLYLANFFANIFHYEWKFYAGIEVTNTREANAQALDALGQGCDGVLFSMNGIFDLAELTKEILFEHCDVSFLVNAQAVTEVSSFRNAHHISGLVIVSGEERSGGHSDWYSGVSILTNLTEMLIDFAERPSTAPSVFIRVSQDFFHEMARVRAVRYLFWRVAQVLEIQLDPNNIIIHCEPIGIEADDENLLTHSTAGLAAVIGGANSISFNSMNGNPRISSNVGNLIRHESKMDTFQDAATGSYFIDYLTDQMIQHVWKRLQEKLGS